MPADGHQPPPYFDALFSRLQQDEPEAQAAFGRHVHWGYWPQPELASASAEEYGEAAERLCQRVCGAGEVRDGLDLLDVGCGLGGTIASLNERYRGLSLTGFNIDPRQLAYAAERVRPQSENHLTWIQGDARSLPFATSTFDVVLAVECIFHFDRLAFFREAAHVLRPGGRLALSDFCPIPRAVEYLTHADLSADPDIAVSYGQIDLTWSVERYQTAAEEVGLRLIQEEDVTRHTLPTYDFLLDHPQAPDAAVSQAFVKATRMLAKLSRKDMLRYMILGFARVT